MLEAKRYTQFAWGVLGINLVVILWGAVVRATGSGAGCGSHWPLCQGEIMPRAPRIETIIEFSHRLSSGLALVSVLVLLIWALRRFPAGHIVRKSALASLIFILLEAVIGAGLVLLEYVAFNQSVARAYWMAGHLINTFLLLAALTLTAWWSAGHAPWQWRRQGVLGWLLGAALVALMVQGASGGITALGDTLNLAGGIAPTESVLVGQLVALRIYHPILAFCVGGVVALATWSAMQQRPGPATVRWGRLLIGLFVVELVLGAVNVALKAPVTIQIVHLLLADLLWITLVLLTASTLVPQPTAVRAVPTPATAGD
ncbi:MAG: COX15/CtaA family protein [Caldilineaceae bacterium]